MLSVMPGNNPYQQYKKSAAETATPVKLLVMLFDGAIRFASRAQNAINENDFETANNKLLKVQDIFEELMFTLDAEKGGEIAQNLYELYSFYRQEVIYANITKNAGRLDPVLEFLNEYRTVWIEVARLRRVGA
jgi:flagellar protein FliS